MFEKVSNIQEKGVDKLGWTEYNAYRSVGKGVFLWMVTPEKISIFISQVVERPILQIEMAR